MGNFVEKFIRHQAVDYHGNAVQDSIARSLDPITSNPIMSKNIIEGVALTTSVTNIEHKLGRAFRGWIITDNTAAATIRRDTSSTADATKFLPLIASASTTVDVYVF